MRSTGLLHSSSKQRLEEFRSKLEANFVSRDPIKDRPISFDSNRKVTPFARLQNFTEEVQRATSPKRHESPKLSHYRSLSHFKSQLSPKPQSKLSGDFTKNSLINYNKNELLTYTSKNKRDRLNDLISIETLSAATKVISQGGVKAVPRVYAKQLKDFCTELLAKIKE